MYTDAVGYLAGKLEERNASLLPVLHLLRHLDELANEVKQFDEPLAVRMIDRCCQLKEDVYEVMQQFDNVVETGRLG